MEQIGFLLWAVLFYLVGLATPTQVSLPPSLLQNQDDSRMKTRPSNAVLSRAMRSRKSVVAVIVERPPSPPDTEPAMSYGSGFVIKDGPPSSLVLTCHHVVKHAVSVRIRRVVVGAGVQEFAATVIKSEDTTDIAVLRVPGLRSELSLALNFTSPLQVNEPAVTIGYRNLEGMLDEISLARLPATSPGCIREVPEDFLEEFRKEAGKRIIGEEGGVVHELILLNCVSTNGVSGGPVVDKHGVIGMATKVGITMHIMLAVSSDTIRGVLKDFAGLPANGLSAMEEVLSRLGRR
ncbi:uncharacterized protein [Miscanthus floridulus]|uniref:uncharacterized protein n=1 Tax=Miscanthus floridulus TaxID=154761 RepID=UPI0034584330